MTEAFDDEWELCFWDLPDFRYAVWRVARDFPRLREDLLQEAALAVVRKRDRIAAADKPAAMLRRVARYACLDLVRRECKVANPRYALSLFRGRRAFSRYLYSLRSREPSPDFLAALREEHGAEPVPAPRRLRGPALTPDQRAVLRDILLEAENWSRHEVIAEFRRRTGREIDPGTACVYCKALGIKPPWADTHPHRDIAAAWARYKHSPGMKVF